MKKYIGSKIFLKFFNPLLYIIITKYNGKKYIGNNFAMIPKPKLRPEIIYLLLSNSIKDKTKKNVGMISNCPLIELINMSNGLKYHRLNAFSARFLLLISHKNL